MIHVSGVSATIVSRDVLASYFLIVLPLKIVGIAFCETCLSLKSEI